MKNEKDEQSDFHRAISGARSQDVSRYFELAIKSHVPFRSGRSFDEGSLVGAGLSHGYVHGILKDGKDPTLENLIRICAALETDLLHLLFQLKIDRQTAEILTAILSNSELKSAVHTLLVQA